MPRKILSFVCYLTDHNTIGWNGVFEGEFCPNTQLGEEFLNRIADFVMEEGGSMGFFKRLQDSHEKGKVIQLH